MRDRVVPGPGQESVWDYLRPPRVEDSPRRVQVRPQAGDHYGGWVTDDIVGPFKGERGTEGW